MACVFNKHILSVGVHKAGKDTRCYKHILSVGIHKAGKDTRCYKQPKL